jgi:hypothetical protein
MRFIINSTLATVLMFVASAAGADTLPTKKAPVAFHDGVYTSTSIEATITLKDGRVEYFQYPRNFQNGHHWLGSYSLQGGVVIAIPEMSGTFGKRLNEEGKAFHFRVESDGLRLLECHSGDKCLYSGP